MEQGNIINSIFKVLVAKILDAIINAQNVPVK